MTEKQQQHCEHEWWCWHQILGCIPLEDGKSKCVREGCGGDTRLLPPRIPLTPALTAYYTERSQSTGKTITQLVLQDLAALHRKRVAREEKRVWKENEMERL